MSRHTEIGKPDQEIGDHKRCGAVQAISPLLDERSAILKESRDICYSHERHECRAKELVV